MTPDLIARREALEGALRGNLTPIVEWALFADSEPRDQGEDDAKQRAKKRRDNALDAILTALESHSPTRDDGGEVADTAFAISKRRHEARNTQPQAPSEERYRHKKRGTQYTLIGVGHVQGELHDEDPVVLYRGDDGSLWVRHQVEFCDGRFERIATDTQPVANASQSSTSDISDAVTQASVESQPVAGGGEIFADRANKSDRAMGLEEAALTNALRSHFSSEMAARMAARDVIRQLAASPHEGVEGR